ncbi:hypothetical protein BWZ22_11020 [Seonamhaeicola sp. S2-3]|uniref:phage tail protein n=1 Tax=Seonamhaeicola sp. S2-3 TaxID=1936081 RepID=UPI0009727C2B|nr:tail fiber protein [Seonamhaeicola sp. S2-3]APY11735.1 hypothetical protein BWZ22_11020 [Seonamhaeicola sp. S2-3]
MEPFIGQIQAFAFHFAPRGWAECNGQLLSITDNPALFSLLGNTYGGDGQTTFALPDLRNRSLVGVSANIAQGNYGGQESIKLKVENLPSHSHKSTLKVNSKNATLEKAEVDASIATVGTGGARDFSAVKSYNIDTPDISLNSESIEINNTGDGVAFNNRNPYLGIKYCIALQGIYPSRN